MKKLFKRYKKLIIVLGLVVLFVFSFYLLDFSRPQIKWGVTFSQTYAQNELGLDWRQVYLAILDDLRVDHIRLSAYWNMIEKQEGVYDYSDLDWQIEEASKRGVQIVLAVGRRLPRWPECHDPAWLSGKSQEQIEVRQSEMIADIIKRYDGIANIAYIQVENEPYLKYFGICPPLDKNYLKEEIKLAKSLTKKPILVTDSGELSTWIPVSFSGGDLLGSTLYRVVYNKDFGYFRWFTPASMYYFHVQAIRAFTPIKKVIVAELQAESWHPELKNLTQLDLSEYFKSMSLAQFKENISFTKRAGFDEAYLWGAEWWYFMKEKKNFDGFWEEGKKLWRD